MLHRKLLLEKIFYPLFFAFLFFSSAIFSQSPEEFRVRADSRQITNSLYNRLSFLDSRADTGNMGIVHSGEFTKKVKVTVYIPLAIQLNDILKNMIDETAGKSALLFQLRKLKFAESDADGFEKGFCFLRANLFENDSANCKKIASIDTVVVLPYTESNSTLMDEASKIILDFISKNLTAKGKEEGTSLPTVQKIDSVEKFNIPLYNPALFGNGPKDTALKNGVYLNFRSFRDQKPDMQIASVSFKTNGTVQLKANGKSGKAEKLSEDKFYVFVSQGQAYASGEFGSYPLYKHKNDFYFVGPGTVNPAADALLPKISVQHLPVPSGKLSPTDLNKNKNRKYYLILVDYLDGSFMRVKEIVP